MRYLFDVKKHITQIILTVYFYVFIILIIVMCFVFNYNMVLLLYIKCNATIISRNLNLSLQSPFHSSLFCIFVYINIGLFRVRSYCLCRSF